MSREARALARIDDPNVVGIHDVFDEGPSLVLELPLITGGTLRDKLGVDSEPMSFKAAGLLMVGILRGLEAIHEHNLVHRDLKPANILLDERGRPKITDFGVARDEDDRKDGANLTRIGAVIGTPEYMSPEQAMGNSSVDHRSDLFSAGIVFFEMMAQEVPFPGDDYVEIRFALLNNDPDWTLLPSGIPPGTKKWLKKSLERNREHRFQSAREMRRALGASLKATKQSPRSSTPRNDPSPSQRRPRAASPAPPSSELGESGGNAGRGMESNGLGKKAMAFVLVIVIAAIGFVTLNLQGDSSTPPPETEFCTADHVLDDLKEEKSKAAVDWFADPTKRMCPEALRQLAKKLDAVGCERDFKTLSNKVAERQKRHNKEEAERQKRHNKEELDMDGKPRREMLKEDGIPGPATLKVLFNEDIRESKCGHCVGVEKLARRAKEELGLPLPKMKAKLLKRSKSYSDYSDTVKLDLLVTHKQGGRECKATVTYTCHEGCCDEKRIELVERRCL